MSREKEGRGHIDGENGALYNKKQLPNRKGWIGMQEIKRATLIGLGAIGSFFAAGLQQALGDGFRVMAEGARKKRLEEQGVVINGKQYHFPIVEPGGPYDPVDLVIIAVKDYSLDEALEQIKNQVGPDTTLMPALNGLDCVPRTAAVYGGERVLYTSMWVAAKMADGAAEFDPNTGRVRFGEAKNDPPSPRVQAVADLFRKAGIHGIVEKDMRHCIWAKYLGNVSENLPCALLGVPYGGYQSSQDADTIRKMLMDEVAALAKAEGVELTQEDMDRRNEIVHRKSYVSNCPSTLQDLRRGRKTEIDLLAGTAIRLGEKYGVPTPVCRVMYHGIKVLEQKNAGEIVGL